MTVDKFGDGLKKLREGFYLGIVPLLKHSCFLKKMVFSKIYACGQKYIRAEIHLLKFLARAEWVVTDPANIGYNIEFKGSPDNRGNPSSR